MKPELEKILLTKFHQFFDYLGEGNSIRNPDHPMLKSIGELINQEAMVIPIQFGIEVGSGWYMLLYNLMSEIEMHISNVNRNRKNEHRTKLGGYLRKTRFRLPWKRKKLRALLEWIENKLPKGLPEMPPIQIEQIKEKFGGLRFYYSGGDKEIDGMVSLAESLSYHICESCGTTIDVGRTSGWVTTICKSCYSKLETPVSRKWTPIKLDS